MALGTKDPSSEQQDSKHNPAERQWADRVENPPKNSSGSSQENADSQKPGTRSREEHPGNFPTRGHTNEFDYKPHSPANAMGAVTKLSPAARLFKSIGNYVSSNPKKSAGGAAITFILVLVMVFITWFSPSALLLGMRENFHDKFMGELDSVMDEASGHVFRVKFGVKGPSTTRTCTVKINCKFRGMSDKEVRKLQRGAQRTGNTITVDRDMSRTFPNNKNPVRGITFNGQAVTAQNYRQFFYNNTAFRMTLDASFQGKAAAWFNAKSHNMLRSLAIGKGKALGGAKDKKTALKALRDRIAGRGLSRGTTPAAVPNETDSQRNTRERIAGISDQISDEADKRANTIREGGSKEPRPSARSVASSVTPSNASNVLRGISILGAADLSCWGVNMISAVGYGAKVLGALQLVRFSHAVSNTTDAMRAGDVESAEMELLGDMFTKPDEEGRGAANSVAFNYANFDSIGDISETLDYRVGGGLSDALIAAPGFIGLFTGGIISPQSCQLITHPITRVAGGVVGFVAAVISGGTTLAWTGGTVLALAAAMKVIEQVVVPLLIDLVAGTLITGDENSVQATNAYGSGKEGLAYFNSRNQGLHTQTREQAIRSAAHYQEISDQRLALKRSGANHFDPLDYYGLLGGLMYRISPYTTAPPATSLAKIGSIITNPLSLLGNKVSAETSVYDTCTDEDYKKLELATGLFCWPKLSMSPIYLSMDIEDNADYMYDNGHVDDDGFPKGSDFRKWLGECVENIEPFSQEGDSTNEFCVKNMREAGEWVDQCAEGLGPRTSTNDDPYRACIERMRAEMPEELYMYVNFHVYWLYDGIHEGWEMHVEENPDYTDSNVYRGSNYGQTDGGSGGGSDDGGSGGGDAPDGPVSSSGFVMPIRNFTRVSNCFRKPGHAGIDFASPVGTPVYAANSGSVARVGGPTGDAGNYIIIQHGPNLYSNYQHLQTKSVREGERVNAGQRIGSSGNTGFSTGPHLHFGVTDAFTLSNRRTGNNSLNPINYLPVENPDRLSACRGGSV